MIGSSIMASRMAEEDDFFSPCAAAMEATREAVAAFNDDSFVPNRGADQGFSDSDDGSNRSSAPSESFHQRSNPSHSRSNSHRRKGETGGADGDVAVRCEARHVVVVRVLDGLHQVARRVAPHFDGAVRGPLNKK